jgi:subtilase family serine protease
MKKLQWLCCWQEKRCKTVSNFFLAVSMVAVFQFAVGARAAERQVVHVHIPAVTAHLQPLGLLGSSQQLDLAIGLPLRNQEALTNLLREIYDPASPNYHHYLTPEQFTEQFGPTEKDYRAVIAFAKANGLMVTGTHPNRLLVDVNGTAADIERAMRVTIHIYQHPTEARTFFAPDVEPSLDLAVPILGISGLNNYSLPHPRVMATPLAEGRAVTPNAGSGPGGTYMGKDFRAAYVPDSSLNGSGQIVGLLQFDGYTASDITYYENKAGLPGVTLTNVLIDGASGNPSGSGGEVEVSLDIEMAISMATNLSQVIVYEAPNPSPFVDILNRMATDNLAKQLSCSWYVPNGAAEPAADQIWQEMAAQGQSFLNASGDNDAYTGLIDFPGDSPYITQVGGTTLSTSGSGGSWTSETVWNWGGGIGSGGGISIQYPIPSWQTNISMTANQGSTTMRNTPDVALTADNVYVRADGHDYNVGGTSCAAPLWAGFTALVNQQAAATGEPAVGFINPAVDAIGSSPDYTTCFHDITTGNNTSGSSPNKFYAVPGYDLCTGWGTPNGQKLINALANPEALQISPTTGFTSLGGVGGPFTVTAQNFSLTNAGTNSLTWTLVNTSLWLNASSSGGTLARGGPATNVTLSLNSVASNLLVGTYSATVWFTNLNDQVGQGRQFNLAVLSPPAISTQPTSQAVLDGATATFTVGATGGLPLYYQWQCNSNNLSDGGNIFGSTTTNLTINDASLANAGDYSVIVSNAAGVAISSNAVLTITPSRPVIIRQPADETVVVGTTAQFTVTAIGTKPFAYQWSCNTTNLGGATNASLILTNVQFSQADTYVVVVTNIYGSVQSSNANLTVTPCDPAPSGLVGWWPGEGNANDIIGINNGTPVGGLSYTNGEVGQAFYLNGTDAYVKVPASSSLNVGLGSGMTIEGWINPSAIDTARPIVEWNNGSMWGVHLWDSQPASAYGTGPGCLYLNIQDANGTGPASYHTLASPAGIVRANVFQHVAFTYDRTSGLAAIYLNGVVVAQQNLGTNFTPSTSYDFYLGARVNNTPPVVWAGSLDEFSLYNRVLSSNEITTIYIAGSAGKCFTPTAPAITSQPANQAVVVGQTATFSVGASGTAPLNYQWTFDTTNITGATNASLILNNVQLNQAGNYSVQVSNFVNSVLSSNATLTVTLPPTNCVTAPSGLVGWWPGEGNANDVVGTNNGVLVNGSYTNGEVGQAFALVGTNAYVRIPANPSLDVGLGGGMTIEGWINPSAVNVEKPILDWDNGSTWGVHFFISTASIPYGTGPGCLYANFRATDGNYHYLSSAAGLVQANVYQHVAFTYDKSSGLATIYLNGAVVALQNLGTNFTPQTSYDLYLGSIVSNPSQASQWAGLDEISLYNRALSSNEVAAIYLAGNGGKCAPVEPPVIISQPTNQTVMVGGTATFSVSATSMLPLSYQWFFGSNSMTGQTNSSLVLTDVQLSQAGNYAVVVSNLVDAVLSSNATLTVTLPPTNCVTVPSGLVSWWPGEGNANDVVGTNNGVLVNGGYTNGEVGQAFALVGTSDYVHVPASPSLDVGLGGGMTIEGWINPSVVNTEKPIVDWDNGSTWGVHFNISTPLGSGPYGNGPGCLYANLRDTNGSFHWLSSSAGLVQVNVYQHVALTFDKSSGLATIYLNGAVVAQQNLGTNFTPQTSYDFYLGTFVSNPPQASQWAGLDEISLYNRALSSNEVAAIYLAGSGGKCFTPEPPVITTQPTNQTVVVGQTTTFSVGASGTAPLSYQWTLNTTNLLGATNTTLILTNVQLYQAGSYAVVVSNLVGSTLSSNATLTVLAPPTIITQPTNLMVYVGGTASFSVTAIGTPPLSYQWNFNTTNIANATNAILVLTNVQLNQAGAYAVLVSNLVNSILSSNAVLTVNPPPTLGVAPSGNFLLMFWPVSAPGFVLEASPSLSPANWVPVPNPPIQIGSEYLESIEISGSNCFYRLRFSSQ